MRGSIAQGVRVRTNSGTFATLAAIRRASSGGKHDLDQRRGRVCVQVLVSKAGALFLLEESDGRT